MCALRDDPAATIPGDFVMAGRTAEGGTLLVSSPLSAMPYYWARCPDGSVVHGPTVFDVVERAGLPWRWNRDALRAMAMLEHPLGEQTLHPAVFRCPAGSVLHADPRGRVEQLRYFEPRRLFEGRSSRADTLASFRQVHREMDSAAPVVSLSSGLDSRLLLASLLSRGHRPRCATMGSAQATDMHVARRIAASVGLPHEVVELRPSDYLRWGQRAAEATSGSKSARHFHTFIYAQRLGLSPNDVHHVGANGGFARTTLFDVGLLARVLDAVHAPLMHLTGLVRIHSRTAGSHLLRTPLGSKRLDVARAFALQTTLRSGSLNRLDELLAYQRVRHFIGNGQAMYASASLVRPPFLDARWMCAVGGLPRADKLGSNFHRYAIESLRPGLLGHATDERSRPVAARAPALYALRQGSSVPYAPVPAMVALPQVHERIIETPALDALVSRADRIEAARRRDVPLVCLLLTLHWTVAILEQRGIRIASDDPVAGQRAA